MGGGELAGPLQEDRGRGDGVGADAERGDVELRGATQTGGAGHVGAHLPDDGAGDDGVEDEARDDGDGLVVVDEEHLDDAVVEAATAGLGGSLTEPGRQSRDPVSEARLEDHHVDHRGPHGHEVGVRDRGGDRGPEDERGERDVAVDEARDGLEDARPQLAG
ncbi:hypothetical protein [Actinomyces radicidentis]|uniref:hypothetical protein n=1 Tax=Actinomyces radicidentis TaxID=111015 RepID=UPI001B808365